MIPKNTHPRCFLKKASSSAKDDTNSHPALCLIPSALRICGAAGYVTMLSEQEKDKLCCGCPRKAEKYTVILERLSRRAVEILQVFALKTLPSSYPANLLAQNRTFLIMPSSQGVTTRRRQFHRQSARI